jgi:hypothetical protein
MMLIGGSISYEPAVDRRLAHAMLRGDLRDRQFASVHTRADSTPLAIVELLRPLALASTRAGRCETVHIMCTTKTESILTY